MNKMNKMNKVNERFQDYNSIGEGLNSAYSGQNTATNILRAARGNTDEEATYISDFEITPTQPAKETNLWTFLGLNNLSGDQHNCLFNCTANTTECLSQCQPGNKCYQKCRYRCVGEAIGCVKTCVIGNDAALLSKNSVINNSLADNAANIPSASVASNGVPTSVASNIANNSANNGNNLRKSNSLYCIPPEGSYLGRPNYANYQPLSESDAVKIEIEPGIIYTTIRDDYRKKIMKSLKGVSLREDIESNKYNNNNSNNNYNEPQVVIGLNQLTFNN